MPDVFPLSPPRRIKVLRDAVARKIAAGEVIDRPLSVLRELIDNSIDAGATDLRVRLEAGGLGVIEVTDDGCGMDRQDLELCWLPHTTSKIETEDDLNTLRSLGFRGEALASISACSRVTILTCPDESGLGWQLELSEGQAPLLKKASARRGTTVRVEDPFYNIPARRKFLKGAATEGTLCRRVLEEKALAVPHLSFQLTVDGKAKDHWPAQSSAQRLRAVLAGPWEHGELLEFNHQQAGFRVGGHLLAPPQSRPDRKGIRVFANGRPLQEYSLVQAVGYAFEGSLPGGAWPLAVLFVEVDPALVDFNIHPAKREARFRNMAELHPAVVAVIREVLISQQPHFLPSRSTFADTTWQVPLGFPAPGSGGPPMPVRKAMAAASWATPTEELREGVGTPGASFRYLGQVLGVFLLAEVGDELYLIDQHAAHERILFEEFRSRGGQGQDLLFPRRFQLDDEAAAVLRRQKSAWEALGIGIVEVSGAEFEIVRLPLLVAGKEKELIRFLEESRKPVTDIEKDFYASLSCRAAVMDGDPLDPVAARALIEKAFALPHARCPHGRPLWTVLSRNELFQRVGRLV